MLSRDDIIGRGRELGFADIGFTTVEPFTTQRRILTERQELYAWAAARGIDLMQASTRRKYTRGRKQSSCSSKTISSRVFRRP